MDTPYYERMQYVGDTRIQALISYTVGGDDRLPRQAIQAFNDSRIPDGITRSRYPSSMRQIIPTFSLLWVGMVHDFWMYRSDSDFVRAQLSGTRSVLDWFLQRQRADGLLTKILSVSDGYAATGPVPPLTKATYYFRFYLARALDHAGMGNQYLQLLGPWREMLSLGLTTWAEQPEPTRSDSHAWSAHPNYDFLTIVAGIRPRTPGFATVLVAPHLGSLKHLSAAVANPKGMIEAEYTVEHSRVKAIITLPADVSGELLWNGKTSSLHAGEQELDLPFE